jgi:adenylate kinase
MTHDEDAEAMRRVEYNLLQQMDFKARIAKQKQEENLERIIKKQKEVQTNFNVEIFREQQKDVLDTESQNIRMYLQDNLVTFLAEGLQEICVKQPEDPVDALAEYLFRRSLEVRYPDPTQY